MRKACRALAESDGHGPRFVAVDVQHVHMPVFAARRRFGSRALNDAHIHPFGNQADSCIYWITSP
ncbi:hypothetical protein GCM10009663_57160 [Kitasatospora arboriphila]|uniref:Transposase IS200-like domain-containing protein n=1 Tax=Kitasatospora arboriphila TaxID=258052 RepID=A0ABP4EG30_9ACTN